MRKRLWLLLCLILLEGICSWSDWRDSLTLATLHQAALQLHQQADTSLVNHHVHLAPQVLAAHSIEDRGWALVEQGRRLRVARTGWQLLSLIVMVAILAIGMWSFEVSEREKRRRKQAETDLRREQVSLEHRIAERTAELQAENEERRLAEERNRRHKRVLELLAGDAPLEHVFRELTESVAGQRRSWECAVHLVDPAHRSLRLIASSSVSEHLECYLRTIALEFPDAPESVACCAGAPRYINSMIEQHRPWSELLLSNGIRSAWSVPLTRNDGHAAGTMTIYSRLFGAPAAHDLEILDGAARLATLVLDVHRMNRELQRKAYEDELTGVANRRAGELRLQQAVIRARRRNESLAVLWIDLDRFKRVNDLYGHTHGDQVLFEIARRLRSHPRVRDAVARMGGDEFLVLLESCRSEEDARKTAGELAALIGQPLHLGRDTATVGASIGITLFPRDGDTPEELERHADAAMYQAKRTNMGWCAFSPSLRKDTDWTLSIEEGLRTALDEHSREHLLEVHYQPIVTAPGRFLAFEALLRFRHPELGPISPEQFIPVAEESRLIVPIGQWILRQVCRQIVAWQLHGYPPLRVGVNISAVQWEREDFVAGLRALIEETGVDPAALTLELTESAMIQNIDRARSHIRELKSMGVRLAMDDFGTGYSSLSYLHQLPLDALKIDRSFVARLGEKNDSRAIIESIIAMAHLLGILTIAEGVETDLQRAILAEMGCDALQGFLFARPLRNVEAVAFATTLRLQKPHIEAHSSPAVPHRAPALAEAMQA